MARSRRKGPGVLMLGVIAGALALGFVQHRPPSCDGVRAGAASVAVHGAGRAIAGSPSGRRQSAVARNANGRREGPRQDWPGRAAWRDYERSRDLSAQLAELGFRIDQDDPPALAIAAEALLECSRYGGVFSSPSDIAVLNEQRSENGLAPIPWSMVDTWQQRCSDVDAAMSAPDRAGRIHDLLERAQHAGAPLAMATQLLRQSPDAGIDETRAGMAAILRSRDPYAIFRMADLMVSNRYGRYSGEPNARYAWQLVACDLGMDCSPTSAIVRESCMSGACAPGGYRDIVQQVLVSPAGFRQVLVLEQKILARYLAGDIDGLLEGEG
jgi:hypothetical protein